MTTRRSLLQAIAVAGTSGVITGTAGCLGDPVTTGAEQGTDEDATVRVDAHSAYGDVLVDTTGMVLYVFTRDEDGMSVCYDDCAETWPALTVDGAPTAGHGVTAAVSTTEREDGTTQVTVANNPLYYYAGDDEPGDANGQGLGDVWYVVAPDGSKVTGSGTDGYDAY